MGVGGGEINDSQGGSRDLEPILSQPETRFNTRKSQRCDAAALAQVRSAKIAQATPLVLSVSGATGRKPGRPCGVRNRNHAEHTPGLCPTWYTISGSCTIFVLFSLGLLGHTQGYSGLGRQYGDEIQVSHIQTNALATVLSFLSSSKT